MGELIIDSKTKTFSSNLEGTFNMIPQEMLISLPSEFSNLWMIADDTNEYLSNFIAKP
jgi:hypothetical protein